MITSFSFVATYISGVCMVNAGKIGWDWGVGAMWNAWGNVILSIMFMWGLLGVRSRIMSEKLQVQTLPDYLRLRYGTEFFKLAGSVVVFVFMIPYTAAVFSSLSYMFTSVFNLPYMTSVVIMAFIGALYLVLGGYKAAAKVDVFQGGIMVLGGIVNAQRHLREVQRDRKTVLPQKLPNHYRISLHVDDEEVICTLGRQQGFHAYQLNAQDDDWAEKILRRAQEIRDKEQRALETQGNNQVSQ